MCAGVGMGELLVLLVIVVMVFGAGKLPQLGDAFGRSIKNFKKAMAGNDDIDVTPKKEIAGKPAVVALDAEHSQETDIEKMRREMEAKIRSDIAAEQAAKKSS